MSVRSLGFGFLLCLTCAANAQRSHDGLVVLYDFTEGAGNIVHDRGPSLGVPGDPIDLMFDPDELSSDPIAGEFGDRAGLISWGESWLNINKDHPPDDGVAHGTPDAAVVWDGGPGNAGKLVDMIVESGQFTVETWVRPETIDNRSNSGRIVWMTVEGTDDAANFAIGQQSCCDGGGQPGGVQVRLNTDSADKATQVILNSDGFLFDDQELVHIVHTHDAASEETAVFVNVEGQSFEDAPAIEDIVFGDNLEGWDPDYTLAVGNDPYRFSRWFGGELHLIAIYNRTFSTEEVRQHFDAGPGVGNVIPGDFNGNGELDVEDINLLTREAAMGTHGAQFDLDGNGQVDPADVTVWIKDLKMSWIGDANLDGEFNSGDFVKVFSEGLFETGALANWESGDWNGDGVFSSGDFVSAFTDGGFEQGPRAAQVPEPAFCSIVCAMLCIPIVRAVSIKVRA